MSIMVRDRQHFNPCSSVQMFELQAADLPAHFLCYVWITAVMVLCVSGLHCLLFSLTPANHRQAVGKLKQDQIILTAAYSQHTRGQSVDIKRTKEVQFCLYFLTHTHSHLFCELLWNSGHFFYHILENSRNFLRQRKAAAITHDENRAVFNATASHTLKHAHAHIDQETSEIKGPGAAGGL